jgi:hypothetical protein
VIISPLSPSTEKLWTSALPFDETVEGSKKEQTPFYEKSSLLLNRQDQLRTAILLSHWSIVAGEEILEKLLPGNEQLDGDD